MKTQYHYALLVILTVLVFALIFLSFQFNWIDPAAQSVVSSLHHEIPGRINSSRVGMKPGVLLVLGVTALMAGGILWSIVNYKKE
ncbi:MAG TPA: hypothetical protein VMU10_08370 [Desulfomonilia bacterium]|nr:hypothetical protein [Desulfomonilia bacterium]